MKAGGKDHLKRFVNEEIIIDPDGAVQSSMFYRHYKAWCVRNGEKPLSDKVIKVRLPEFDLVHGRINGRSFWKGVKLKI